MHSPASLAIPTLAIGLSLLGAACAEKPVGGTEAVAPASCETVLCRDPGTVNMQLENGEPYIIKIDAPTPYVDKDVVTILPGETLFIEGDTDGDNLVNLRAVSKERDPARTVTFEFSEPGDLTMLKVTNGFPQAVKFHAKMRIPGQEGWRETSTCPVGPNGFQSFESWPHPISGLMLMDFRLGSDNAEDAGPCVY
jgi:hypothetical protein